MLGLVVQTFANNQDLLISFTMAGPTGATGPVVQGADGQILVWRDTDSDGTPDDRSEAMMGYMMRTGIKEQVIYIDGNN